jgi:hypothetical protein
MGGAMTSVFLGTSFPAVPPNPLGAISAAAGIGAVLVILGLVLGIGLVGGVVILIVANRADPDPSGRRPQSVYFFAVAFITVLISIASSVAMVEAVTSLMTPHGAPIANSVARTEVLGGLLLITDLVLARNHLRRGVELARAGEEGSTPARRVGQSYGALMAFLMVLVLIVTIVTSVYLIFALAAPGIFGSFGGRSAAGRDLIVSAYTTIVALAVLRAHLHLVPPRLHIFRQAESWPGGPATPPTA